MKRFLAFLLLATMLAGLMPAVYAAPGEEEPDSTPLTDADYFTADLMWEAVNATEDRMESKKATVKQTVEAIVATVTSSPYYEEDSLIRNGDHVFWETTDGIPCGYSPRLSALSREATPREDYDPATAATVLTSAPATRGGFPGKRDVFLIQPYYGIDSSFTTQYVTEAQQIADALGGTATTYRTTGATVDAIADAIEAGAVVIFDSHGDTDYLSGEDSSSRANTSYICLQTKDGLTAEDYEEVTGTFGTYYHAFYGGSNGSMKYYCVDGTVIANHMDKESSNSLLWMAICLGMATDGMHAPLRAKGVEVCYGYSQSVTFQYDYDWESAFWSQMLLGKMVREAISYMKEEVGLWDWCHASSYDTIAEARAQYCAFPIVVSSEDVYPGQGNVDDLQAVYSTWTLAAPCTHGSLTFHQGVSPKCLEEGSIPYYECTSCGALFTDAALENRITTQDIVIPSTGHSYSSSVTAAATCTEDGIMTYTCSACSYSYTETISATGHNYVEDICTGCGMEKPPVIPFAIGVSGTYVIAAKVNGEYMALPNTFSTQSSKLYPIRVDGSLGYVDQSEAEEVALELTYDALTGKYTVYNGDYYLRYPSGTNLGGSADAYYWTIEEGTNGTWQFVSETSNRGLVYRASSYNCFGGYYLPNVTAGGKEYFDVEILPIGSPRPVEPEEPAGPILDESIKIGHSLNLASDISMNYAVTASSMADYDSFYLECRIPVYEGTEQTDTQTVTLEPVLKGDYYYFTLTGITAVHMSNEIVATLYMTKEETSYYSAEDVYSVADYAYAQLHKTSSSQSLKKLCAELLRYGSAAQTYKAYRTDALPDGALTQEEGALLTDLETVTFQNNNKVLEDVTEPTVTWAGKTLNLDSKVTVKFVADLTGFTGDPNALELRYSYVNWQGETVTGTVTQIKTYVPDRNFYAFDLDTLLAAELRTVITAAVYCDGVALSPTILYSPDTYGNGRTGTLLELCKALMAYSDAALAYFNQ